MALSAAKRLITTGTHAKPKFHQRISVEYAALLLEIVPPDIAARAGVAEGSTWAEAIARAIVSRAVGGDVNAARELAERTEGRVPAAVDVEGKIDYAAGQSAKGMLMKKLAVQLSVDKMSLQQ